MYTCDSEIIKKNLKQKLKSLGPIDRKFHGLGKNIGFVWYEYIIKQCSSFCKYTNTSAIKKRSKKIACQQLTESTSCFTCMGNT